MTKNVNGVNCDTNDLTQHDRIGGALGSSINVQEAAADTEGPELV